MSITITGTSSGNQGVMNRVGKLGHALNTVCNFAGMTAGAGDMPTEVLDAVAMYDGATANRIRAAVAELPTAITAQQDTGFATIINAIFVAAQTTIVEMSDADNPLPSRSVPAALYEFKLQVIAGSATVDANEPTIGQAESGTGTGVLVLSLLDGEGKTLENSFAEVLELRCTSVPTGTGFSTDGQFAILGEAAVPRTAWNWPQGSGATGTVAAHSASSSSNVLSQGNMETWSGGMATGWALTTGTFPTHCTEETSVVYMGSKAIKFIGDGATAAVLQSPGSLTTASGSLTLSPRTNYGFNLWCRMNSNPAAGVITIDLWDGSSTINDDAGNPNSFTIDCTTLGTTFVAKTTTFRTPSGLPSTVRLRIRQSTAITNTHVFYFDEVCLLAATQLYGGGPFATIFVGATNFGLNKVFMVTVTNDYRGAVQQLFNRFYGDEYPSFLLPSATGGAETINDNLIG